MSPPAPATVKVLFANEALPATPVLPTSWDTHGLGSPPPPPPDPAVVKERIVEVAVIDGRTGVAKVSETTFQKYVVPGCSVVDQEYVVGGLTTSCAGTLATRVMLPDVVPK